METLQPIKWPHLRTVLLRVDERVQRSIRRCFPVSLRCTVIPVNLPAASLQVVPSFHLFMCGSRCRHSYLGRITNHPSCLRTEAAHHTAHLAPGLHIPSPLLLLSCWSSTPICTSPPFVSLLNTPHYITHALLCGSPCL